MTLFLVSLTVSIVSVLFSRRQAKLYETLYAERIHQYATDGTASEEFGYGTSPRVIRSWFDQGLDLATNFPAAILTLVSYAGFSFTQNVAGESILILVAVCLTIFFFVSSGPEYASHFIILKVSWTSWIIIAANVVGALICTFIPSAIVA